MSVKNETDKTVEVKEIELTVLEVLAESVIVKLDGWRKRVYFENVKEIADVHVGGIVKVKYTGDINDVHSVIFQKVK